MVMYAYKAVRDDGKIMTGSIEAMNALDLEAKLEKTGFELIFSKEKKSSHFFVKRKIDRGELIDFFIHMEQMVAAGVPILESIEEFKEGLNPSSLRTMIESLVNNIESGKTLSAAMAQENKVFSKLTTELIKVGEISGNLPAMFGEIKDGLIWQDELISKTKKLMMYPIFVGTLVFGVLCFMMMYLVPQMTSFIASLGGSLPIHTRALIATSDFFIDYWYVVLLSPICLVISIKISTKRSAKAKLYFDRIRLRIPMIGNVLQKIILARFASNFALLYRSGIGVLQGLDITCGIVNNRFVEQEIRYIHNRVTEGSTISDAFNRSQLFPPLVLRMIKAGEHSGNIDKALVNVSYFYDRDVKESIDKVERMIEPTMTVILGALLGWIMVSVLGPVYSLISSMEI